MISKSNDLYVLPLTKGHCPCVDNLPIFNILWLCISSQVCSSPAIAERVCFYVYSYIRRIPPVCGSKVCHRLLRPASLLARELRSSLQSAVAYSTTVLQVSGFLLWQPHGAWVYATGLQEGMIRVWIMDTQALFTGNVRVWQRLLRTEAVQMVAATYERLYRPDTISCTCMSVCQLAALRFLSHSCGLYVQTVNGGLKESMG